MAWGSTSAGVLPVAVVLIIFGVAQGFNTTSTGEKKYFLCATLGFEKYENYQQGINRHIKGVYLYGEDTLLSAPAGNYKVLKVGR